MGTFDLSVKEITGSLLNICKQRVYTEPIFVTKITNKNGVVLEEFHSENNEALSEETAAIMVKLLQGLLMVFMIKGTKKDR